MKKIRYVWVVLMVFILTITGCQGTDSKQDKVAAPYAGKISVATQYGLAYAPLQIVQEKKLIEKYLPGVQVEWKQMGTGPVIRDAMVTGQIDVGFMGGSPFLIGWDKGAEWKICTASGSQPVSLVTYRSEVQDISGLKPADRIATPAVASIQHILLSMAAEKTLGNAKAFDGNLVSVTHPDAAAALLSKKDITAHFSSPPYLYEEIQTEGIHEILNGEDAFGGEFTFIFGVATNRFHDENPQAYSAFVSAFNESIAFINNEPREAARLLAPQYNLSEEEAYKYLTWEGTNYCSTPYGVMGLAEFMHKQGHISKMPQSLSDIAFENVQAAIGQRYGERSVIEQVQYRDGD